MHGGERRFVRKPAKQAVFLRIQLRIAVGKFCGEYANDLDLMKASIARWATGKRTSIRRIAGGVPNGAAVAPTQLLAFRERSVRIDR
jgi:hypothetical protein